MNATSRAIKKHADELEAELAFANRWISELVNDLAEARAQIAAKDAWLRAIRNHLIAESYTDDRVVIKKIDAALATPARETE